MVGTKRLPKVRRQLLRIRADSFHAGIVRGNGAAVNINIQTGMVDKFTLISLNGYKIRRREERE
jgi:hypothetical protein